MSIENIQWVEELFLLLDISATKEDWLKKYDETLHSLKNEVQFMISTLNNNESQLIQEAQKRVTSFYINSARNSLTNEMKVVASEILLRNQQPELALTILQPIDMEANADYFINFGRALMQIGIFDQSKYCFITALEKEPESPEPLFHLGFHASINGEAKNADKFYRECLEKDENHTGALLNLAYLYYQLEKFEEAIEFANKVIGKNSANIGGYLTIIACFNAMKNFSDSAEYINKAREKFGEDALELDELEAVVSYELENYERAIELVSRYLIAKPTAVDLRYIRGRSNIKLKNWNEALVDVDEFLSLEPFDTESLEMRFNILFSAKRWAEAEIAYIKLLENAPQLRIKYQQEYAELRKRLAIVIG
ncbi:tetratricopeptide repeat protein [Vibrio sp. JC009]|uniref:tetratricopeptide repeat protein n=1 Tax=Vibrio sp. JC009 TaxID=2912314 RepID=UPI0023AE7CA7|nr:tetratricopeptide repeat protein [Vibrio sp. JC009]WED24582.1 tetratricopeptide repeat protein [Vibrio sp. JC009]